MATYTPLTFKQSEQTFRFFDEYIKIEGVQRIKNLSEHRDSGIRFSLIEFNDDNEGDIMLNGQGVILSEARTVYLYNPGLEEKCLFAVQG